MVCQKFDVAVFDTTTFCGVPLSVTIEDNFTATDLFSSFKLYTTVEDHVDFAEVLNRLIIIVEDVAILTDADATKISALLTDTVTLADILASHRYAVDLWLNSEMTRTITVQSKLSRTISLHSKIYS